MARLRMARAERYKQLLATSWELVREEGTDALTLGRLAERAGVTKPVVYSHFPSRPHLLTALYGEYDSRQAAALEAAIAESDATLAGRAHAIAQSYVGCVLDQGPELTGITAALEGSPELELVKREAERASVDRCRELLRPAPGSAEVPVATIIAIFGAAEALSQAAASDSLSAEDAVSELGELIVAVVASLSGRG
ncbi:TetR/AcrR family transcriptional regulator [Rhodococcus wratislaviensis]|uniref:TetR/AcrR family transcriptional regulator n=1 Tax=Rhodococcus wratislaviensis TaxID=44752 RepID=UPI0036650B81